MSVGWPALYWLHEFGSQVWWAFGDGPYHVGSSLELKNGWRDVDVRLILDDEKWDQLELGDPDRVLECGKRIALEMAFSALGRSMTNLPIDFQIQRQTQANARFPGPRSALGVVPLRFREPDPADAAAGEEP